MCLLVDRYPQTKGPMTKKFVEPQKIVKTPNTIGSKIPWGHVMFRNTTEDYGACFISKQKYKDIFL